MQAAAFASTFYPAFGLSGSYGRDAPFLDRAHPFNKAANRRLSPAMTLTTRHNCRRSTFLFDPPELSTGMDQPGQRG
jgi:hypothetical protein